MADTDNAQTPPQNGAQMPQMPQLKPLGQFIRDLSFENNLVRNPIQGRAQPDIQVQVALDAKKRQNAEDQYEVITKYNITSKNKDGGETLFLLELEYGGIFSVSNIDEKQLHPFLLIEGPRILFPYVRRIVSDVTQDGGFPALNLEPIDFVALYRQSIAQRAQAQQANADTPQA